MPQTGTLRTSSFKATVRAHGRDFPFRICHRPLSLGSYATIDYYWMDSSAFRIARSRREGNVENFRNCVGHWWASMQSMGLGRDRAQVAQLLLAVSYPLGSRDNGLQNVYRDAHPVGRTRKSRERSLPDDDRRRIKAVVASRDAGRVREELDLLLGRPEAAAEEEVLLRRSIADILDHGIGLLERRGDDGVEEFLGRLDAWIRKRRRKGGGGWRRDLLDRLSYECKVAFYRCYANTWIDLIPRLREQRGLDGTSERFLRLWHMQNQPVERPDGRVVPDVFGGQVLALHPLSGFFMRDPAFLGIAGRFVASDPQGPAGSPEGAEEGGGYWSLVGAILSSAALYRQDHEDYSARRSARRRIAGHQDPSDINLNTTGYHNSVAPDAAAGSDGRLLAEFVRHLDLRCPSCRAKLESRRYEAAHRDADDFDVELSCPGCGNKDRQRIPRTRLETWLQSQ